MYEEDIYEELLDVTKCSLTSHTMSSGYDSYQSSRRPTSSPDSGVFLQDRLKPTTQRKQRSDHNNKTSKVRFADEVVCPGGRVGGNDVNSGDYVLMTGSGLRSQDEDTTESQQQYIEMTPPKNYPKNKSLEAKKTSNNANSMLKGKGESAFYVYP